MTGSAATSNHPTMTFDTLHAISSALHKERYARILPRQSLDVTNEINDTKKTYLSGTAAPRQVKPSSLRECYIPKMTSRDSVNYIAHF